MAKIELSAVEQNIVNSAMEVQEVALRQRLRREMKKPTISAGEMEELFAQLRQTEELRVRINTSK